MPNVSALIPQLRWVYVSSGTGDDMALAQTAIESVEAMTPDANGWRGVLHLDAGESQPATSGTRLLATDARAFRMRSEAAD